MPFHKLSQWLTYSLTEPIEKILGWSISGRDDMTGLPEYRSVPCPSTTLPPPCFSSSILLLSC